jgi:antitoxin CcdA
MRILQGSCGMSSRRAVNLTIDADLVAEARALAINLSQTAEEALRRKIADEKTRRWQESNADAIRLSNEELERNGLWSDGYRLF